MTDWLHLSEIEFKLVDIKFALNAGLSDERCGVTTADSRLKIFGMDFLPEEYGIEEPDEETQEKCIKAYGKLEEAVDRAKKAFKDAQELLKAYYNLGEDENFTGLCEQIAANPNLKNLRWQYGIDDDLLSDQIRQCEFVNWLNKIVLPKLVNQQQTTRG